RNWRDLKPQLGAILRRLADEDLARRHEPLAFHDIGQKIRQLRLARGWSVETLAARSGLQSAQLKILEKPFEELRLELGAYRDIADLHLAGIHLSAHQLTQLVNLGFAALERLAHALQVPLASLVDEAGDPTRGPARSMESRWSAFEARRLAS